MSENTLRRSFINEQLRRAVGAFTKTGLVLPVIADLHPDILRSLIARPESRHILSQGIGWDLTAFGHSEAEFAQHGLTLFTLFNEPEYAAKLLFARAGQVTPIHSHYQKKETMEVMSGVLAITLWPAHPEELLTETFELMKNGGIRMICTGGIGYHLEAGQSITIPPGVWHTFHGHEDQVVLRETSTHNNDEGDNNFIEGQPRFNHIEEDEAPFRWLVQDYARLP